MINTLIEKIIKKNIGADHVEQQQTDGISKALKHWIQSNTRTWI